MGLVDKILGGSREKALTSNDIRRKLTDSELAAERARAALAEARTAYQRSLLDDDVAAPSRAKAAVLEAEVAADRAEALVPALRERFEAQCEIEAEADRKAEYEDALRKKTAAVAALKQHYRRHAEAIRDLLGQVAEAELAVAAANEDLPAGATPIQGVEASIRDLPSVPARVVARHLEDEVWCYSGESTPSGWPSTVSADLLRHIKKTGRRTGTLEGPSGRLQRVVKRQRFRVEKLAHAQGVSAVPLAFSVSLPGLAPGEEAVWIGQPLSPAQVLEAVELSRAADRIAPKDPRFLDQPTWDYEWGPEPASADGDDDAGADA